MKSKQGSENIAKSFIDLIEPYWKIITAAAAVIWISFKVGVWVGEHNNIDELSKQRSEYILEITKLNMELSGQDRRPIVINLNDSVHHGK